MTTQHIGAAGELLVQYRLLKAGIDSARLTIDAGIDLVVYAPGNAAATTVQVKTNLAAGPAGEKGALSRGWNFPHACPAQFLALVALDVDCAWLFTLAEARDLAQQHSPRGIAGCTGSWNRRPEAQPAPDTKQRWRSTCSNIALSGSSHTLSVVGPPRH